MRLNEAVKREWMTCTELYYILLYILLVESIRHEEGSNLLAGFISFPTTMMIFSLRLLSL